jgi:hypothetical protein
MIQLNLRMQQLNQSTSHRAPPRVAITIVLLVGHCWAFPVPALAYRPFDGTDADVADQGEFELELGPVQFQRVRGRNALLVPATVLNLGVLPRTELVVDFVGNVPLSARANEPRYSLIDTDVLLKIVLRKGALQDETGPSIACEGGPTLPELGGERGVGALANLIVSERWSWLLVHLNNEGSLSRRSLQFAWTTSMIAEFRWSEQLWPVTELLWERELRSGTSLYSALLGAIWSLQERVSLDGAFIVASDNRQLALEGRLGFTWVVDVWHHAGEHAALR